MMKVISTGIEYDIYPDNMKSYDSLPAGYYNVKFSQRSGFWLEKYPELVISDTKIYGIHISKVNKVLTSFDAFERNLGVILSGDKGIGKSLFARLLGKSAVKKGMPVIIVDRFYEGIGTFIDKIDQEVMVLFDEFDKTFSREENDCDPQASLLSLFDGVSPGKKLFVVTCNYLKNLNGFMVNRPGRFHYHFRFDYPSAIDIKEYLSDKLRKEYYGEIEKVIGFSNRVGLNYDSLRAIAFELNQGLTFSEAIKDVNIVNIEEEIYKVQAIFKDGTVLTNKRVYMDTFSDEEKEVTLRDSRGSYAGEITFVPSNLDYDTSTACLGINASEVSLDYCNYEDDDKEKLAKLVKKELSKVVIRRVYDKNLHYAV